ncbi:SMI1/KNR4 family protein [Hymenobacter psychrotolerans]|uniref:SMI1 / KNR4 family (SUKH-1) n=1 Tax=Hymenobacter psychrotolerans DSM 18569 TaxID=1121959 RepID=A0A1M6UFX3_9BACT|nr:SMI1/KNR4 family protein [Hymenobacter psychrotolerans]SHK68043.1 SMI1 / KNR4 family (SUKH-1) [Hymenobacter psychrotolerans DSM 18569]
MQLNPATFWRDNDTQRPPLTAALVREAETTLGVQLPPALLDLLRVQNGGYTNEFAFPMPPPTPWGDDYLLLDELFGIVPDPTLRTTQNLLDTPYLTAEWCLPPRQVLLAGDGHTWLSLDYRAGPVPAMVWLDADDALVVPVAPSFEAFLAGLVPAGQLGA